MSPAAAEVSQGVGSIATLGEKTLLRAIHVFGEGGLRTDPFGSKRLGNWFGRLIEWADGTLLPYEEAAS